MVSPVLGGANSSAIQEIFKIQNEIIFSSFDSNRVDYQSHIEQSRAMMMYGAKTLNPNSKVVVIGPGPLEPLADLVKRCGELILVNNDETALKQLADRLPKEKVSSRMKELTEGLYARMEELFERAIDEKWNAPQVIDAMVTFFNEYRPKNLLEDDYLKDADYVVSAQIGTQFTVMAENRLGAFFKDTLKMSLIEYMRSVPENVLENYGKTVDELRDYLYVEYAQSLAKMVKPTGTIFFSDTEKKLKFFDAGVPGVVGAISTPMINLANTAKIKGHYQVLAQKEWIWSYSPKHNISYNVGAYLFKPKQG